MLEAQLAHLNPIITEALSLIEKGGAESAAQYRDIVIPHLTTNVVPNLAAGLALTTRAMMTQMIQDAVQVMSEKTVVTKHDDCGRVLEFVKAPLVKGFPARMLRPTEGRVASGPGHRTLRDCSDVVTAPRERACELAPGNQFFVAPAIC